MHRRVEATKAARQTVGEDGIKDVARLSTRRENALCRALNTLAFAWYSLSHLLINLNLAHRCGHLNEQAESPHSSEFPATSTSQGRLKFALLTICVKYSVELNGQAGGSCSVLPNIRFVIGNGAPIGDVVLIPQHRCLVRLTFTRNAAAR